MFEVVGLAKKLDDLGYKLYATTDTAATVRHDLGIDVVTVGGIKESDSVFTLLESGQIGCVVYTGALHDSTLDDYIALHRRCVQLSIPCLTSLDTANALADIIAAGYTQANTELVDINNMRSERMRISFSKMQGSGNDYIFIENFDGAITCPQALCISLCSRNYGIGAVGIVLIEHSDNADARMRVFNTDGSEGQMAGNSIRCVGKYLYDNGIVNKTELDIETASGVKHLYLNTRGGRVTSVCADMGRVSFNTADIPALINTEQAVDYPLQIGGEMYNVTLVSVGNPHCVVFCGKVDDVDIQRIGPLFENARVFPDRINTEFVRVVNEYTLKMRVFERGSGETLACGTGACAAVAAATRLGYFEKGRDITVKLRGGDLVVNYTDERITLTGDAVRVFDGVIKY